MAGYNENFLLTRVPLPTFSAELKKAVLKRTKLRNGIYADYVNYTVVMDENRRAPIFAALNIDQNLMRKTKRSNKWKIDSRIGKDLQLDNDYYRDRGGVKNPWDRGHLAMRDNAGWGASTKDAQHAANETFYYSNCTLQHENYNPDEWYHLEEWVGDLDLDIDGKISCFSGPIYGDFSRTVRPPERQPAEVPAAFFKVVFFVNKDTKKLDVRAFIVIQDEEAIADRKGRKMYNVQSYQSTVREIQERTGLRFKKTIASNNPLLYVDTRTRRRNYDISHFPERIEVDRPEEIIDGTKARVYDAEDKVDVYLAAALVNPAGKDKNKEWISILNLERTRVNLSKWKLKVLPNYKVRIKSFPELTLGTVLKGKDAWLNPGESVVVKPLRPLRLTNTGSTIVLFDNEMRQIDRIKYVKEDVKVGLPVVLFEYQPDRQ